MIKHNGKYYLQYAAIGLEFLTYSHGVYADDSPFGPFYMVYDDYTLTIHSLNRDEKYYFKVEAFDRFK